MSFYAVKKTQTATEYMAHERTLLQACDAAVIEAGRDSAEWEVWDHRGHVHFNHIQDIAAYVRTMSEDTAKLHVMQPGFMFKRQAGYGTRAMFASLVIINASIYLGCVTAGWLAHSSTLSMLQRFQHFMFTY